MAISKVQENGPVDALAGKTCTPCKGGVPPLTPQEALALVRQVPRWELREDARSIERTFRFRDFREALGFVQRVGELAEAEGHHPDIRFGWGYATVSLQTKKIKGLHENDFIVAAKIDRLVDEREARLDEAIAMTFPASDPIAVGRPTGTEAPTAPQHKAPASRRKKKQGA
jgi:4a-hydroxytetrahydrobiopterin dehydratase